MPSTSAERMRKMRQKLKEEGNYDKYKQKHAICVSKYREKKKEKLKNYKEEVRKSIQEEERRNNRERVARFRCLKKERAESKPSEQDHNFSAYKSASSLGKATARARRALPNSPRKKSCVVKKLFETYVGNLNLSNDEKCSNSKALDIKTVNAVKAFYTRDDVSRQAPGLKDVRTIRKPDGSKERMQIRHLYSSLKETHALFISEHGNIIGRSKFADLRPKHVLLSCQLPHNVCMCKYHENFILAVNSLHKVVPACPAYSSSYLDEIVCQSAKEDCWMMKCTDCKDKLYNLMQETVFTQEASILSCSWYVWKEEGRLTRVQEEGTAADLAEYIISLLSYFLEHCFVKREQAKVYNEERLLATSSNFKPNVAVIQVDFSENFTCSAQDEVQSFHWVQPQVSLFTIAAWYSGEHHPMVIVSDNLDHTKQTVVAYMDRILEEIPKEINKVSVWSDGPSSQFKNRYIAASLKVLQKKHKLQVIKWNYFATSHGKGPIDGTGGKLEHMSYLENLKFSMQKILLK